MTPNMRHLTHEMWHWTCGGRCTFSQNFSSLAITVLEWRCFENIFKMEESMNELIIIDDRWILRTAPAIMGLLKICRFLNIFFQPCVSSLCFFQGHKLRRVGKWREGELCGVIIWCLRGERLNRKSRWPIREVGD